MPALLLLVLKVVLKNRQLYSAPRGDQPPPFWIRALLVATCTCVSFGHGSNDGQKGMDGVIMLILVGIVPTAYALNRAFTPSNIQDFGAVSERTASVLTPYVAASTVIGDPKDEITEFVRTHEFKPSTMLALRQMIDEIGNEMAISRDLAQVPPELVRNFRNDMYLVSKALRLMQKSHKPVFSDQDQRVIDNYKRHNDSATKFIFTWVKVVVALSLGLGTMVGWKRIVVTVGE